MEYSTELNTNIFCCCCCLFLEGPGREKTQNARVESDVDKWLKMKSIEKEMDGKLTQYFSSNSYWMALSDYYQFMMTNNHVDIMLQDQVQADHSGKARSCFNTEVATILMNFTWTLGKQSLPFRESNKDENWNFQQIVKLVSRHNSLLRKWHEDTCFRPYHTIYLSASSQNEMINVLVTTMHKKIVCDIWQEIFHACSCHLPALYPSSFTLT